MPLSCTDKGIPERLHKKQREAIQDFSDDELLFRRFNEPLPKLEWNTRQVKASIFKLDDDSYVRELFSDDPKDVLYNKDAENADDHFFNWGVVSFKIDVLKKKIENDQPQLNGKIENLQFSCIHDPEECIYPHTELHIYIEGKKPDSIKPRSLKAVIRDHLIENCKVVLECNSKG